MHHAACHALGAAAGVSHGDANSIVLPHAMAFNAVDAGARADIAACAAALGATESTAEAAIDRVRHLQQVIGVPTRLRDRGVDRELLPAVAERVMAEKGLYVNPRRVAGPHEVLEMLEAAW